MTQEQYVKYLDATPWPIPHELIPSVALLNMPDLRSRIDSLRTVWAAIETCTGFRWRATSFFRDEKKGNHRHLVALDLAPDTLPGVQGTWYSQRRGSDPVLHKRYALIRQLDCVEGQLKARLPYSVGIFVENDHLHVQLFRKAEPYVKVIAYPKITPWYKDGLMRNRSFQQW